MGVFFVYSLKTALCLIAFYLVHKLLLSHEKLHAFNRFMLLSIIVMSLVVPFIKLATGQPTLLSEGMVQIEHLILSSEAAAEHADTIQLSLPLALFTIYIIGVIVFLLREVWSVARLTAIIRQGRHVESADGATVIVVDSDTSPFSWFGYVLISEKDYRDTPREILIHEMAHIRHFHSFDIALCNLLIAFQWYNPAVWLLRRELQDVHEFEADEAVLEEGVDAKQYQMLLIKKSVGERLFSMANNLNHNSLKRRIRMMKTKKSNRWLCLKAMAVLPVAAIAVAAFANPKVESVSQDIVTKTNDAVIAMSHEMKRGIGITPQTQALLAEAEKNAPKQQSTANAPQSDDKVFKVVEQLPEFPGGMNALMQYLAKNIKYPKGAEERKAEGRVLVQFVVMKDGSISNAKVVKGVDEELDAEALRVINGMPKWKPGMQKGKAVNTQFTIPVMFRLNKSSVPIGQIKQVKKTSDNTYEGSALSGNIVIVINDKKATKAEFEALKPADIESVYVLKNKEALKESGYEEYDGAIIVKTKQ